MNTIKIFTGDIDIISFLFEKGLHPKNQIKKVERILESPTGDISIYTNSPHVAEAFNKFGKKGGYAIECYFENEKVLPEVMFGEFAKPFHDLIFGKESDAPKQEGVTDGN